MASHEAPIPLEKQTRERPGAKSAPSASVLPHVAWSCIASHLSDDLQSLLHLATLSPDLKKICRPYISPFFEKICAFPPPIPGTFYYNHAVHLILEGFVDASSVRKCWAWREDYTRGTGRDPASGNAARRSLHEVIHGRANISESQLLQHEQRVWDFVHESTFIPTSLKAEVCASFEKCDPDAALVILVLLCTKLKFLEIPEQSAPLSAHIVQSIAQEYQRRGMGALSARREAWAAMLRDRGPGRSLPPKCPLPLSELLVLYSYKDYNYGRGISLPTAIPFMGIPSLHRIVLVNIVDHEFPGWPGEAPSCSCPEIYLQQSCLTRRAAVAFAQGINPPCEIRQWFQRNFRIEHDEIDHSELTWDRVLVESSSQGGEKRIHTRIDLDGGNPGQQHAWASWLFHGKMSDWRRLDEEFSLEEGDELEDWLSGVFG